MTEKQKAMQGELYNAMGDKTLIKEREKAKDLCYDYNKLKPSEKEKRQSIIKKLLGKTGGNFLIEPPFYCDYGSNIEIGENFYMNHNCVILDGAKVRFRNNVLIGPNCSFYTVGHPLDVQDRKKGLEYAKPITIEDNVWIGGSVTILPGVTVRKNSIIGAGSIVTKDIPPYVVAVRKSLQSDKANKLGTKVNLKDLVLIIFSKKYNSTKD